MARFGFCGPTYALTNASADAQRCMNFYPESVESSNGKTAFQLVSRMGMSLFSSVPGYPKASLNVNGTYYVASTDGNLYSITSAGVAASVAAIPGWVAGQAIKMAYSNNQIVVVNGARAFCYNYSSGTNTEITVGSAGTPLSRAFPVNVTWSDTYFIVLYANSPFFQVSGLNDGTSWNGTDVYQMEFYPDDIQSVFVDHREMWAFGANQTQGYYNSGAASNPWTPVVSAFVEDGILAPQSPVKMDNSIFWLGGSYRGGAVAYRAQGYTPARISNHAVEAEWQSYSVSSDAIGFAMEVSGHNFWYLYFPTVSKTWVFDASNGMWHEEGYWKQSNATYVALNAQNHAFCYGKHLVGDWNSGNIYQMSTNVYTDNGDMIRWMRRAPYISSQGQWLYFDSLELSLQTGLALQAGQGDDPYITVRWSDDNTGTWSNDHTVSAGKVGEYGKRVILRRLGKCWGTIGRVFEVVMTDPIPWRITDAYIEGSPNFSSSERYVKEAEKVA